MSRGRGRPYRPPLDSSPWASVSAGTAARTAWLLGTSRMLRADGAYANRQEFLPQLLDRGVRVDNTKLSRWESGTSPVTPQVLQAYEEILGLPAQQLRAPVSLLTGVQSGGAGGDTAAPAPARTVDLLVETALGGDSCGGDCWVQLTAELADRPAMFLRSALWRDLATRLISELSRSVGVAYTARLAALHQLIAHPMAHNEVVAVIGQYVTDPHAVRVQDVIAALAHAPSASGRFLALGLLTSDNRAQRAGAARAIAAMQASHTWSDSLEVPLEKGVLGLLGDPPTDTELAQADGNADLLRYLSEPARARVLAELGDDLHQRFVLDHASLISPATASLISAGVSATAQEGTPLLSDAPDPMLERLVREALFHSHAERRHCATVLLMASPYAPGIACAVAGLLNADDPLVARRAADLLRHCITPAEAQHVLEAPVQRPEEVQAAALAALGHVPELAEQQVDDVLEHTAHPGHPGHTGHPELPARPEFREPARMHSPRAVAAVYVLGMHGLTDRLAERQLPSHVESAAAWWRRAGARVAV